MAGNNSDPTWTFILFLALVGALCYGIWYMFSAQLLEVVRYLRLIEIAPLTLFDSQASACFTWLKEAQVGNALPTTPVVAATQGCFGPQFIASMNVRDAMSYYTITADSLGYVSRLIGMYLRWILGAACLYVIYYAMYKTDRNKFRTTFNLESFIKIQAKVWKVITPIVNFVPSKSSSRVIGDAVPSKLPLFAEALVPEEWISYHQIPMNKGIPQREATYNAFAQQLGPRWAGLAKLPPYMQALAAAFALKGVQKREESDELLGKISTCWNDKTGFRMTPELAREVRSILKDPKIGGAAAKVAGNFAYRTTALLGVLKWARFMGGVLASAQFLWLRGVDRHLWYAMNNLGRRSFHTEGAGAMGHFMAEELAKKALVVPRLETAIITINKYMSEGEVKVPDYVEGTKVIARS